MTTETDQDTIIQNIISTNPEKDWLELCRAALPEADDGEILGTIEILSGGDILALEHE